MITTGYCPYCEEERLIQHHISEEPFVYKGETFLCTAEWYSCFSCGKEWEVSDSQYDPWAEAKMKYEMRNNTKEV